MVITESRHQQTQPGTGSRHRGRIPGGLLAIIVVLSALNACTAGTGNPAPKASSPDSETGRSTKVRSKPDRRAVFVSLDETFVAIYPELSRRISGMDGEALRTRSLLAKGQPGSDGLPALSLELDIARLGERASIPGLVVASPLAAQAPQLAAGGLSLVVLEGDAPGTSSAEDPGRLPILSIRTDRETAYRKIGKAAGAYIASLVRQREAHNPPRSDPWAPPKAPADPRAAIVFAPTASRPESLVTAFEDAYREGYETFKAPDMDSKASPGTETPEQSQAPQLLVETLGVAGVSNPARLEIDFMDTDGQALVAARRLASQGATFVFLACGRSSAASTLAAGDAALVVGLDSGGDEKNPGIPGIAFCIVNDPGKLTRHVALAAGKAAAGKPQKGVLTVPARILKTRISADQKAAREFQTFLPAAGR